MPRGNIFELQPPRETLIDYLSLKKKFEALRARRPDLANQFATLVEAWLDTASGFAEQLTADEHDWQALGEATRQMYAADDLTSEFVIELCGAVLALPE
jgi:enoyl-CoA hydratase/carnithine racemase